MEFLTSLPRFRSGWFADKSNRGRNLGCIFYNISVSYLAPPPRSCWESRERPSSAGPTLWLTGDFRHFRTTQPNQRRTSPPKAQSPVPRCRDVGARISKPIPRKRMPTNTKDVWQIRSIRRSPFSAGANHDFDAAWVAPVAAPGPSFESDPDTGSKIGPGPRQDPPFTSAALSCSLIQTPSLLEGSSTASFREAASTRSQVRWKRRSEGRFPRLRCAGGARAWKQTGGSPEPP